VHLDRWSTGRVVLVGDAGYCPSPLTGMGTSLALVGAYVLAGELARAAGDHVRAFAAYEERMRPYVKQGQQLPPGGMNGYAPRSAFAIRSRVISSRMMVTRPLRGLVKKLFFSHAEAIELPDYSSVVPAVSC
jgi:2-polyprenyl-6-methoxyphenol hydroxylase-like FAD-dependent oxidoreductase